METNPLTASKTIIAMTSGISLSGVSFEASLYFFSGFLFGVGVTKVIGLIAKRRYGG